MHDTSKSITDLLKQLGKTIYIFATATFIVMSACLLFLNTKMTTDNRVAEIISQSESLLSGLREAIILNDDDAKNYVLNWIKTNQNVLNAHVNEAGRKQLCFPVTYKVRGFEVCWHGFETVSAVKPIQGAENKELQIIFKTSFFGDASLTTTLSLLFAAGYIILLFLLIRFFQLVRKNIVDPVTKLHLAIKQPELLKKSPEENFKLKEFRSLLAAITKSQETEKQRAIANTVKIVAHDVRKPLSIAKGAMALLQSKIEHPSTEFERALVEAESKITSASKSVEAMLQDILGYSGEMKLLQKSTSIISLAKSGLTETANWYPKPLKIPISTSWNHTSEIYCDFERMLRVLTNILTNACQAMNKRRGSIWLSTTEHNGIVEITIGNSYSSIPAEIIENIFDANFTHGKKNGNGLGLAVVKKTVEAHGGKVVVTSDEEKQIVEFKITLTASKVKDDAQKELDQNLGDFHFRSENNQENNEKRATQIELIQSFVKQKGSKVLMGILDDEEIFRQTVKGIVENSEIKHIIHVKEFGEPESLLSFELNKLDFLISDIDLESNLNGYDVVKRIREGEGERRLPICISSNKALSSDLQQALDAGATTFLPKPMTLDHLLKFMCDSINFHRQNQQS